MSTMSGVLQGNISFFNILDLINVTKQTIANHGLSQFVEECRNGWCTREKWCPCSQMRWGMCEPKSASHCATIEGEGLPSVAGHFYSSLPAPSPPQPHMSLVLPHRTPFYGVHIVHSVFGVGAGIAVNEILCATSKALTPKYLGYDVS